MTNRLAIVGIATMSTYQQALQQIPRTVLLLARPAPVRVELLLRGGKQLGTDQRRDRDGNPLCSWGRRTGVELAGLGTAPPRRTQAGTSWSTARLSEGRLAFVGRIREHIPQG